MENKGIIGAVCGDIIGSVYEFHKTKDMDFKLFTPYSKFTDDTVMTCAVAEWLVDDPKHSHEELVKIMHRYGEEYPHSGYGGMFKRWLENKFTKPYNSFGNGAAMRVSPIAYCYDGENQVLDAAAATAMPSHNHDEGIKGAQTVALAIHLAINERKKSNSISKEQILSILDKCVKFSGYNIKIEKEEVLNRFDETCQGTVPVALWIIRESNSFEDAIRKAVCLGADADTLGAIVGGIAEAIWGIPENLKKDVISLLPNEMVKVINEFYQLINNKIV